MWLPDGAPWLHLKVEFPYPERTILVSFLGFFSPKMSWILCWCQRILSTTLSANLVSQSENGLLVNLWMIRSPGTKSGHSKPHREFAAICSRNATLIQIKYLIDVFIEIVHHCLTLYPSFYVTLISCSVRSWVSDTDSRYIHLVSQSHGSKWDRIRVWIMGIDSGLSVLPFNQIYGSEMSILCVV